MIWYILCQNLENDKYDDKNKKENTINAKEELAICADYLNNQEFTSTDWFVIAGRVRSHFNTIEKQTGCVVESAWSIGSPLTLVWFRGNKVGKEEIVFKFSLLSDPLKRELLFDIRGVGILYFPSEQFLEVSEFSRAQRAVFLELGINCYEPDPVLERM